ncbi:MAG: hypothetical protein NT132_06450, partial [Microbacterium sp.]|nr:hypothetical protein [Microbacterium sp.]
MADFAQHLPLSQRRGGDESGVSADRRADIADLLEEAARLLADAPHAPEAPHAPNAPHAPHAPDAQNAPDSPDPAALARTFLADAALRLDTDDLAAAAAAVRAGRRRRIRDLSRT